MSSLRLFIAPAFLFLSLFDIAPALAQPITPGVIQHGAIVNGNCTSWYGPNQIEDAGAACGSGGGGLPPAGSNLDFYVAPAGSDTANTCLVSAAPCATKQHAANVVAGYDWQNQYSPTIHVADGNIAEEVVLPVLINCVAGGTIIGNTTTPDNVTSPDLGGNFSFTVNANATWTIQGFSFPGTVGGINVLTFGTLYYDFIDFSGNYAVSGLQEYLASAYAFGATLTISSSMNNFQTGIGGYIVNDSSTWTFLNSPIFAVTVINVDVVFLTLPDTYVNGNTVTSPNGPPLLAAQNSYLVGLDKLLNFPGVNGSNWPALSPPVLDLGNGETYKTVIPSSGDTIAMAPGQKRLKITPGSELATLTVQIMPIDTIGYYDGGSIEISTTQAIDVLTLSSIDGTTILGAPPSLAANTTIQLFFSFTTPAGTTYGTWYASVVPTAANPSATASDMAVNGGSESFMRADAAPAVQKGSASQFGLMEADNATVTAPGGVLSTTDGGFPVKYYVGVYCPPGSGTPLDPSGATDMGACFNSAITAAYNGLLSSSHTLTSPNASAEIDAPCGSYLLTTPIVPLAAVRFNGGGKGCTVFLVNNATAGFEQTSGTQLIFADWSNFAIRPTSGNAGATPFVLRSVQYSSFQKISCEGFTTGVCALIAPLTATISPQLYDYCAECGYANSIFNRFDFTTNTAGTVFSVQGHYSSGTTCDVVTTDNDFMSTNEQVQTAAFVDSFCADSNHWHFPLGTFLDNNAILFQFGNDSAHSATDVDVYGQQIDGLVSRYNGTATGMIFLQGGNVSYNHIVHLTSDLEFPYCTACFTLTHTQNSATISFAKLDVSGQLAMPTNANFYNDFIQGGNHGFFASVLGANAFGAPSVSAYCYDNTTYSPFAVLVGCTSDARLKDIAGPISLEKAKKALVALDPIQYHWKPTASKDRDLHAHFTAQDVYKVMPECRNTLPGHPADDPYYGIDDGCVLAYAWKIIKDQEHRIGKLEHNNANAHRLSGPHHAGRSGRPGVRLGH